TANPATVFDLKDIRQISLLPKVTESTTFKIAKVNILSKEFVSSANDPEKLRKVNLVNFDNCDVGSSIIPSNVSITGYKGSQEIVQLADGSKVLQVNVDQPVTTRAKTDLHQLYQRTNIAFGVKVPKGTLKNLSKITYRVVNNSIAPSDNVLTNVYYVAAVTGSGFSSKQGESSVKLTSDLGDMTEISFEPKKGIGVSSSVLYWKNAASAPKISDDHMESFDTVYLYLGVPECAAIDTTNGWNLQIGSIDLEFTEPPTYEKDAESRMIVNGNRFDAKDSSTLSITTENLKNNNINYRNVKTVYNLNATAGNEDYAVFQNSLSTFMRNANSFIETAKFRVYTYSSANTKLKVNLVSFFGEKLPFEIDIQKNDNDKYIENIVALKDIYNSFKANYPEEKFHLANISSVEIAPDSTTNVIVAGVSLWTGEPGSGGSSGNFYFNTIDDSARIEGYFYAIQEDYTAEIEIMNAAAAIGAQGTRIPVGSKPVAMAKFTLKNADGDITTPANRFWISLKVPAGVNLNDIGIYRVFLDGSVVKERHVFEPNGYISVNTFFASDTFVVLAGVKNKATAPGVKDDNATDNNTEDDYDIEYIYEEGEEEVVNTPSQVVRKKKVIRKKSDITESYTWLWILIVVISVVVLAAVGVVTLLLIRKKRRKGN
ncbi:MAG: hypothetical protein PHE51_11670, partial [Eubacteriales bacterium]|nr:hypothetical protein [Eubacteriales bacterium]